MENGRLNDYNNEFVSSPKFNLNRIPTDFMSSELTRMTLLNIISSIERCRESQSDIDAIYQKLCDCIITEMNNYVQKITMSSKTKQKRNINTKTLLGRKSRILMERYESKGENIATV